MSTVSNPNLTLTLPNSGNLLQQASLFLSRKQLGLCKAISTQTMELLNEHLHDNLNLNKTTIKSEKNKTLRNASIKVGKNPHLGRDIEREILLMIQEYFRNKKVRILMTRSQKKRHVKNKSGI